ncbi:MAG TPA: hypothetical protein ENN19_15065, partial [Chloroflexi bacterium]|nr:hypothetical protein [Chloroflexota bacterium]
ISLNVEIVSVIEIIRQRIEEFRRYAEDSGVAFDDQMPDHLTPVQGDWERLVLVFGHLIENAIKFSPDGGVVKIQAWEGTGHVRVSISDQGIGIPVEHLDRIFERFYQVDGSASRRFGGMGVGLALVWEIVEAHNGTVVVESDPGAGSTFTVILPQVDKEFLAQGIDEGSAAT